MKARIAIAAFALSSLGAIAATNVSSQSDTSQVLQLQQALTQKGFDAGPADGQMGARTKAALRQFQQAQGLQASGQIDTQTLAALSIGASGSQGSNQQQPSAQAELQQQQQPQQDSSQFSPQSAPQAPGSKQ